YLTNRHAERCFANRRGGIGLPSAQRIVDEPAAPGMLAQRTRYALAARRWQPFGAGPPRWCVAAPGRLMERVPRDSPVAPSSRRPRDHGPSFPEPGSLLLLNPTL